MERVTSIDFTSAVNISQLSTQQNITELNDKQTYMSTKWFHCIDILSTGY